jgi:hypothetical protein
MVGERQLEGDAHQIERVHRHPRRAVGLVDVTPGRQRLVKGVGDGFIDSVVRARAVVGIAYIHAGPLAHGVEALEDLDAVRPIIGGIRHSLAGGFSHGQAFEMAR